LERAVLVKEVDEGRCVRCALLWKMKNKTLSVKRKKTTPRTTKGKNSTMTKTRAPMTFVYFHCVSLKSGKDLRTESGSFFFALGFGEARYSRTTDVIMMDAVLPTFLARAAFSPSVSDMAMGRRKGGEREVGVPT